jgi:hypothetical protein
MGMVEENKLHSFYYFYFQLLHLGFESYITKPLLRQVLKVIDSSYVLLTDAKKLEII